MALLQDPGRACEALTTLAALADSAWWFVATASDPLGRYDGTHGAYDGRTRLAAGRWVALALTNSLTE